MAKHLTNRDIAIIVDFIHAHNRRKLKWDDICEASERLIGKKPTRQSLSSHQSIKDAYVVKKESLKLKGVSRPVPSSLKAAADRIFKLQTQADTLKQNNSALLEQFVIWQYNAYKHGLTESQLNAPLPRIDREITE